MKEELAIINALWIGDKLGPISRCCLYSFIMRGHVVNLYTYGSISDLPEGISIEDARSIIPEDEIIRHRKTGSYALFSDIFRYALLNKLDDKNLYVDCDVYCIEPIRIPKNGYFLGYEDDNYVNGAVLALPTTSVLLEKLLFAANDPMFIPEWYQPSRRYKYFLKKKFGFGRTLEDMPWGVIGPAAITHYVKSLELIDKTQPIDVLYPVHHHKIISYLTSLHY